MNSVSTVSPGRRWLNFVLLTILCWAAFLGVISAQHVLSGAFAWSDALRMTVSQWASWMALSPFILWLTFRYPIERHGWLPRVIIHVIACVLSVVASNFTTQTLLPPPPPPWADNGQRHFDGPPPDDRHPPGESRGPGPGFGHGPGHPPQDFGPHGRRLWFRAQFDVPIYLILVSLGHAIVYFRRSQQRELHAVELEAHLAQARLQALRMQLHPHFLFNTLNAISTLVHTNPRSADEMIGGLSEMLRMSLDSASESEVPLSRELHFLNHYLEIEKVRFGDRLRVEQTIAPDAQSALLPTLILQPLVENAIRHGIEPKVAPGQVIIQAQRVSETLRVTIRDTGIGFKNADEAGQGSSKGIGLSNTRARLQALYPSQHRLSIQNHPDGGGVVELEIPYHTA